MSPRGAGFSRQENYHTAHQHGIHLSLPRIRLKMKLQVAKPSSAQIWVLQSSRPLRQPSMSKARPFNLRGLLVSLSTAEYVLGSRIFWWGTSLPIPHVNICLGKQHVFDRFFACEMRRVATECKTNWGRGNTMCSPDWLGFPNLTS